ncbi:hypothetical protein JCM3765_007695 [Sporobolomyces pararoseus]
MDDSTPTHGTLAGFAPRKSSYLRISPTLVLQLILYLEPHHVEWMNVGVLERILIALRERIPLKLEQEEIGVNNRGGGGGKSSGKQKDKVDVFRGSDYQMAFFFRKTNDKHVVLLKEKHLHYITKSVPRRRSPPSPPPPIHHQELSLDDSNNVQEEDEEQVDALGMMGPPTLSSSSSRKRSRKSLPEPSSSSSSSSSSNNQQEEVEEEEELVIKPEPIEEDPLVILNSQNKDDQPAPLFRRREESETPVPSASAVAERRVGQEEEEEEMKEELDEDVKPQLRVNYQKFEIFNRSLVVIVEPYPPLTPSQLSSNLMNSTSNSSRSTSEIRQLSASVQPSPSQTPLPSNRRSESIYSRAGTLSVTPVPTRSSSRNGGVGQGGSNPLFRSRSRSETTTPFSDRGGGGIPTIEEEDEQMRSLREMSQIFRTEGFEGADDDVDEDDDEEEEEEEEDLPSLDEIVERSNNKRKK